jgi:hypothetical protein
MTRNAIDVRGLVLAGAVTLVSRTVLVRVRPGYLRWGATDDEIARQLPGDESVSSATWGSRSRPCWF